MLQPEPARPVGAVWLPASNVAVIGFSESLAAGPSENANWTIRYANQLYPATDAQAAGFNVTIKTGAPSADVGPNQVVYAASPADVIGSDALPVAPFTMALA